MTSDQQLDAYRASIDNIDAALVHLLAERFKITQAVGRYKADGRAAAGRPGREDQQIARLRALAVESGLDPAFTEKFLRFIVDEVILHHKRIAAERDSPMAASASAGARGQGAMSRTAAAWVSACSARQGRAELDDERRRRRSACGCHVAATPV